MPRRAGSKLIFTHSLLQQLLTRHRRELRDDRRRGRAVRDASLRHRPARSSRGTRAACPRSSWSASGCQPSGMTFWPIITWTQPRRSNSSSRLGKMPPVCAEQVDLAAAACPGSPSPEARPRTASPTRLIGVVVEDDEVAEPLHLERGRGGCSSSRARVADLARREQLEQAGSSPSGSDGCWSIPAAR